MTAWVFSSVCRSFLGPFVVHVVTSAKNRLIFALTNNRIYLSLDFGRTSTNIFYVTLKYLYWKKTSCENLMTQANVHFENNYFINNNVAPFDGDINKEVKDV